MDFSHHFLVDISPKSSVREEFRIGCIGLMCRPSMMNKTIKNIWRFSQLHDSGSGPLQLANIPKINHLLGQSTGSIFQGIFSAPNRTRWALISLPQESVVSQLDSTPMQLQFTWIHSNDNWKMNKSVGQALPTNEHDSLAVLHQFNGKFKCMRRNWRLYNCTTRTQTHAFPIPYGPRARCCLAKNSAKVEYTWACDVCAFNFQSPLPVPIVSN